MRKLKIGLALRCGAARGWSHIGVINALRRAGIEIDIVAGCSYRFAGRGGVCL
ncbi:patatin-like phospholipase family protein [Pseudomonas aeruginosa]